MTRPELILLHGALGSKAQFENLVPLLNSDFRVHAFDFSGHGEKEFDNDFSIDQFVADVEAFMKTEGISKADFFGYSMGGYVALKLASVRSEKVGRIVTLGTKFDWTPSTAANEVKLLNPDKIEEKIPKFAAMLVARHGQDDWKGVMNRTAQMMLNLGDQPAISAEVLNRITSEVVVSLGAQDNMVTPEESAWACRELSNARFEIVPDFVHPIEKLPVDGLAQIIRNFLV